MKIKRLFNFSKQEKEPNKLIQKQEMQNFLTTQAITNASLLVNTFNKTLNNTLDYSIESLRVIDYAILKHVYEHQHTISRELKTNTITFVGSYIFEVARRSFGGNYGWHQSLHQPILITELPNFEISIMVYNKVKLRIENGNTHNIPLFFSEYEKRIKTAQKGDKITIS